MYFKFLILSALFFLLVSCDGFQEIEGVVVDSETKQPISNVELVQINGEKIINKTDDNGYFNIGQIKGFAFGDKEMTVVFSRENYTSDTITFINNESKLIKLEKIVEKQ
ncbi:hypothetical protein [Flavobacterium sp.]|uniref:hypothetical protein n=1 Tax=Flavobacterium sp. TaxID=239 RepID=UPI0040488C5D